MSDPLDDDLKRMKIGVPVPPDFLARVRAQIAQEQQDRRRSPAPVPAAWWRSWADFFSTNPFPVAAVVALVIFSAAVIIWKVSAPTSSPSAESMVTVAEMRQKDRPIKEGQPMPEVMDTGGPDEVVIRIEFLAEEQMTLAAAAPALAPMAQSRAQVMSKTSTDYAIAAESHLSSAPGGCMEDAKESAGGCVVVDPGQALASPEMIHPPIFQSSHGAEETIRLVEQIARDYSVELVDDKLKEARRELGKTSRSSTVMLEIPTSQTNEFMIALQRAMAGESVPASGRHHPASRDTGSSFSERVQIKIEIALPPNPSQPR